MTHNILVLHMTKLAAWVLTAYAAIYTLLLVFFLVPALGGDGALLFFVLCMLALATTPVFAIAYLPAVENGTLGRAGPFMALAMACPTVFWGYMFAAAVLPPSAWQAKDFAWWLLLTGVPAALSSWLCIFFVAASFKQRHLKA